MRRSPIVTTVAALLLLLLIAPTTAIAAGAARSRSHDSGPFDVPSAAGQAAIDRAAGLLPPLPAGPVEISPAGEATEQGGDVITNDPSDDSGNSTTQSETSLGVFGDTVCGGYNNSGPGGFSGLSRSDDRGTTWTDLGGIGQSGDPAIAVDDDSGTFYYAEIATIGGNPAIGVATSTDDCQTFGAPTDASPGASAIATTTLNDKPWIDVDDSGSVFDGNLYACWTRFDSAAASELRVSRSTDGGTTWVNEQIITTGTSPFGCSIHVGPAGQVYLAWADRAAGPTQDDIRFSVSTDGGVIYSAPASAATGNRHPGTDNIVTCPTGANPSATRPTLNGNIRMLHQAWLAVDTTGGPNDGNLYLVWASDPAPSTIDNSDVFFSRSTNGGGMWSPAVQMGDLSVTDQFEPFVAVGGTGQLVVAWYDRRNDTASNFNIDVYAAISQDGGVTFDPDVRITDQSFPVPPINPNFDPGIVNCYMGEYIAAAADATTFYFMWGDNRNTVTNATFPSGRADPDVFFDSMAIPGVNQPPTADADGPYTTPEGTDVTLDGSGSSDPDVGDTLTYEWDFDYDGITFDVDASGPMPTFDRVGNDRVWDVALRVTDGSGESDIDTSTVTVTNVAPSLVGLSVTAGPQPEKSDVEVTVTVTDPGWLDDLSVQIDWGDGTPMQSISALDGEENVRPDASGSVDVTRTFGDNGTYTITVCGLDDDTSTCDSRATDLANVDPTSDIQGTMVINGQDVIIGNPNGPTDFDGRSSDPGSDDLTFDWTFGDGDTATATSLVNDPVADLPFPPGSPSVQPRVDEEDSQSHTYADACLYLLELDMTDDDLGTGHDEAAVIIAGNAGKAEKHGFWHHQYKERADGKPPHPDKDLTADELLCYLEITKFGSAIFDEVRGPLNTLEDGEAIFHKDDLLSSHQEKLDKQLFAAWLNFANGAFGYAQPIVDTDKDGVADTSFADAVAFAEPIRANPASTKDQLEDAWKLLEKVNKYKP